MKAREERSALASEVLALARDALIVRFRFFDAALALLRPAEQEKLGGIAADGTLCRYDPVFVLKTYRDHPAYLKRAYLHLLLHGIFSHGYRYDKLETELWDLCADAAVENVILELGTEGMELETDRAAARALGRLREETGSLTAERIYRYLRRNRLSPEQEQEFRALVQRDLHVFWKPAQQMEVSENQWKKISERIQADLASFTRTKTGGDSLEQNLAQAVRDRYDYSQILRRFTVSGENMAVNDEEFDYIFYTYGLEHYGNLPLIEPLEYREEKKVREFVIVLDTSASCRGPLVRGFLQKTYNILKSSESFFRRVNIHVIQCDSQVQSDAKITGDEDFEAFIREGKLAGFGSTDFRPAFAYVNRLKAQGEFEDLKGLIYFTDGYGIYPEQMPDYQVIFAFLDEDENRAPVPAWSIGVVLESEELEGGEPEGEKLECGEPECGKLKSEELESEELERVALESETLESGEPEREQPGQASGRRKDGTERE